MHRIAQLTIGHNWEETNTETLSFMVAALPYCGVSLLVFVQPIIYFTHKRKSSLPSEIQKLVCRAWGNFRVVGAMPKKPVPILGALKPIRRRSGGVYKESKIRLKGKMIGMPEIH